MMIARHTRFVQTVQLLRREKAHRRAQVNLALLVHGLIRMNRFVKFFAGQRTAGRDDGKAVNALALVHLTGLDNFLLRQKIIDLALGVMMRRLRTVFAVLRTAAASAVDNRTEIDFVTDKMRADLVCAFA